MSVKNLIAKFEQERVEIQGKIDALKERDRILGMMLGELSSAQVAAAPQQKAGASTPRKPRGKQKGGTLTVREAIMSAVASAREALPANEIIAEAVRLSGGAIASIRTQINSLTRGGDLAQEPYEGRGFKYRLASGSAPEAEAEGEAKPKPKATAKAKSGKAK